MKIESGPPHSFQAFSSFVVSDSLKRYIFVPKAFGRLFRLLGILGTERLLEGNGNPHERFKSRRYSRPKLPCRQIRRCSALDAASLMLCVAMEEALRRGRVLKSRKAL